MILIAAMDVPPAIIVRQDASVPRGPRAKVKTIVNVPLRVAWNAFVPVALPDVFPKSKGPIPAVRGTSGQQGRWDVVGRTRSVHLSNDRTVLEEITYSDPSAGAQPQGNVATFSYRVSGFSGTIGGLAREAHGTWRFEQVSPYQTRIEWTYVFVPKSWFASIPLSFVVATSWRSYMRDGINNIKTITERPQLTDKPPIE